uniref:Uncharacterized protein n=1 Tax=Rhizochromulina marina TaxID=1034831 RepID=A0A7S2SSM8_9STRA
MGAGAAATPTYSGYTFWSSDFHISPIADLKDLFKPLGMHIIDKSLSGHCHLKKTCAKNLRVLTKQNGISLGRCPNNLRRDFFRSYVSDPQMTKVDAFLCHHACGLCEAFMPFNKSLIVVASTRYEIGRHEPKRWVLWNQNLRAIAANPRNVVAANNRYDAEYIKYFTGIQNVPVLPNFCAYTKVHYAPSKDQILIGPGRGIKDVLHQELQKRAAKSSFRFARIRDLYPHFEYSDLVKHRAIVLIPYQVSIMSIFEYYRMSIPLFVPSPDLLSSWQLRYRVMDERTWAGVFKNPKRNSPLQKDASYPVALDPNNEFDHDAIKYWIKFADFYQWPHIVQFNSWEELLTKLASADLNEISRKMQAFNIMTKEKLIQDWKAIFHKMFHGIPPAAQQPRPQLRNFDQAMAAQYNAKVSSSCVGESHHGA